MDNTQPTMQQLFAQLGLPDDEAAIRDFVREHRPLPMTTRLFDAPFWSPSQATLIQEKLQEDGEWSLLIDTLNAQLRAHPVTADMPQGAGGGGAVVVDDPALQGEGNISAARRYDASAQAFVASGQVDAAAHAAAPGSDAEARALRAAEEQGLAKARS